MREKFREIRLSKKNKERLDTINEILEEYREDGYVLTLRQLFYQLVSRDIIPNQQNEYSKLSKILKEGRLAGVVDWEAIEDRLRKVSQVNTWNSPKSILNAAANQFAYDRLQDQENYIEVWVEKDALSQVVKRAADQYQVPVLVNRGYGSVSAMYDTYQRMSDKLCDGFETATILYLGDHDPSGLDMVRDVNNRLNELLDKENFQMEIVHIALTLDQINTYDPPPNPAKLTDSRAKDYVAQYGYTSWEVDALPPPVLNQLIVDHIESRIDIASYNEWKSKEESKRKQIRDLIAKL